MCQLFAFLSTYFCLPRFAVMSFSKYFKQSDLSKFDDLKVGRSIC